MPIGLRELAEICDVSHTTVSRALRNDPRISDRVRHHINQIAAAYNYKPNHLVKGVISGKSQSIAVILSNASKSIGGIVLPIQQYFLRHSYSTMVYNTSNLPELEFKSFHEAVCHRVEGLIVAPVDLKAREPHFQELMNSGIPFVLIGPDTESINVPHICADDYSGSYQVVEHLIGLGHQRIAYLRGGADQITVDQRYKGYLDCMQQHGLPVDLDLVQSQGWEESDAYLATTLLIKHAAPPTAIFCANDNLALGALKAVHEKLLRVPQDVSIAGMGDAFFSDFLNPPLTTTSSIQEKVGQVAAEHLWKMIQKSPNANTNPLKKTNEKIVMPIHLIERASTGAPPSA